MQLEHYRIYNPLRLIKSASLQNIKDFLKFEVITVMPMKSTIFLEVTPCSAILTRSTFNYTDNHFSYVDNFDKFRFRKVKGKVISGLNQLSTTP
jgi:hypothetical protein